MKKREGTVLFGRLSTMMAGAFIAIVIIFSALGLMASRQVNIIQEAARQSIDRSDAVRNLQEWESAVAEQTMAYHRLISLNQPTAIEHFQEARDRRLEALAAVRTHVGSETESGWLDQLELEAAGFDQDFLGVLVPAWQSGDSAAIAGREQVSQQHLDAIDELTRQMTLSFNTRNAEAQDLADGSAREARAYLLFAAITGVGLSLIIIGVSLRRFSRPVAELKQASLAMTNGDLGRRVRLDTHDEIADLGKTFNMMADSVQHQIGQLTRLSEIALAVSCELEWERVAEVVMAKGMELTGSHAAAIVLFDEEKRAFTETYTRGLSPDFSAGMKFRPGGLAEEVLLGNQAVFSDDLQAAHRLSSMARQEGIKAFICLPLKVRQRKLGVFYVYSRTVEAYGRDEHSVLSILASQAAIAIQNAWLFERSQEEAVTDGLTCLYNQKYFYDRLGQELERSARTKKPLSVIFCDLDKFKAFNDLNGHGLGDEALRQISRMIMESKRAIDIAARYGGEEFAVILPETDSSGAQIIAHRIRRRIAGFSFRAKANGSVALTASIGVASYPEDSVKIQDLVDKADWCMYYGKRQGGNRVTIFHEESEDYGQDPLEDLVRDELHLAAVQALAQSVDTRNRFCSRHAESVARLAAGIAAEMRLPEDDVYRIRVAGLLHDIGFVSVPEEVVNKRENLTKEEWEQIKTHPEVGATILRHIASLESFIPAIRHHHEHFDGEGYPDGLARERIPLSARIISVADAYQAMICDRPYRKAMTVDHAISELKDGAGTQFDPGVVEAFISLIRAHEMKIQS